MSKQSKQRARRRLHKWRERRAVERKVRTWPDLFAFVELLGIDLWPPAFPELRESIKYVAPIAIKYHWNRVIGVDV